MNRHTQVIRLRGVSKAKPALKTAKRYKRIKTRDESEWLELPEGTTPAIVSPEQFKAVRTKLDINRGESTRNQMRPELLRGMVFCGDCGRKLYPETEVKRAKAYERKIYRCPSRSTIKCNGKAINADKCESAVWAKVCDIINNPHIVAAEMETPENRQRSRPAQNRKRKFRKEKSLLAKIEARN